MEPSHGAHVVRFPDSFPRLLWPVKWCPQASVIGRGPALRLLEIPSDPLHQRLSSQQRVLRGAFLLPHRRPAWGLGSQGAGHCSGLVRFLLERALLLGALGPRRGLSHVFPVDPGHLPPDDGHRQAGVVLGASWGHGGLGQEVTLRRGVRALRGGRGAHIINLHEDGVTGKVLKEVPRLHRVAVVHILRWILGQHLRDWGGLVNCGPFW